MEERTKNIVVGICGASGVVYGLRLLKALLSGSVHVHLVVSNAGKEVLAHEEGLPGEDIQGFLVQKEIVTELSSRLTVYQNDDFFAPFASGSFRYDAMVVAPCSMGTLAAIASGLAENLIHRSADVCIKEKRPLILLPRETPLSTIHLENMLRLSRVGVTIMPPSPSFYSRPETIDSLVDTVIARVLDHVCVEHSLGTRWGTAEQ